MSKRFQFVTWHAAATGILFFSRSSTIERERHAAEKSGWKEEQGSAVYLIANIKINRRTMVNDNTIVNFVNIRRAQSSSGEVGLMRQFCQNPLR